MGNSQSSRRWNLLVGAILADLILCIVLLFLFGLVTNLPSEPDEALMVEDTPATIEPTATETVWLIETPTLAMSTAVVPSPMLTPTPLATSTPEPTRREFLEPTKQPYVFPTPIYIPPIPRERPTPVRLR